MVTFSVLPRTNSMSPKEDVLNADYFATLVRMRQQIERKEAPGLKDVMFLVDRCHQTDKRILEVVDLLAQARPVFRSKHLDRARELLEELL